MNKNKEEALQKARASWEKIKEGGKELGNGTKESLYLIFEGGHDLIKARNSEKQKKSKIKQQKPGEDISNEINHLDEAKEEALQAAKIAGKELKNEGKLLIKGAGAVGLHALKGGYNLIDAGDKAFGEKIEKKQKERGKDTSGKLKKAVRNNLIKSFIVVSSLATVSGVGIAEKIQSNQDKEKSERKSLRKTEDARDLVMIPMKDYNHLYGKEITTHAPLTQYSLGGDAKANMIISDTLTLSPAECMHTLWNKKITKYGQSTNLIDELDDINVDIMTDEEKQNFRLKYPVDATYLFIVRPYINGTKGKTTMTLNEFISKSNKIIDNEQNICKSYKSEDYQGDKLNLYEAMKETLTGESIIAYAMTELCEDSQNGVKNKEIFDLMLRNHGVEFLALFPAVYDKKTSYGLYQFTEYALCELPQDVRGASKINGYLKKEDKLPGSVIDLNSWELQTVAAYRFAIDNFSIAINKLNDKQIKKLLNYKKSNPKEFKKAMIELVAMMHHMPYKAQYTLGERVDSNFSSGISEFGSKNIKAYGLKTRTNYDSLTSK